MENLNQWAAVLALLVVCCCAVVEAAVQMKGCTHDDATNKYAEVILQEGRLNNFNCTGISQSSRVDWKIGGFNLGHCLANHSCESSDENQFIISRTSTQSEIIIKTPATSYRLLENSTLYCTDTSQSADNCVIDLITPSQAACFAEVVTSPSPWTVQVKCNVSEGYSSRLRYKCQLYQRLEGGRDKSLTHWFNMAGDSLPRTCQMTAPLNISAPQDYSVRMLPGDVVKGVTIPESSKIRRPEAPSIECTPDGWVPEGSNLSCLCTASNMGQPSGRLRWSEGVNGLWDIFNPLMIGSSGVLSSSITVNVKRQDNDNKRQLRCDVTWAEDVIGPVNDVRVGYPASGVTFAVNQGHAVPENSPANFTCSAIGGLPESELILRRDGEKESIVSNMTQLRHIRPAARCEDSGVYTCTANNKMGPDKTMEAELNVTCKPRDISREIEPVYYRDQEIQFSFEVVANPPPHHVNFSFMGPVPENTASSNSKTSVEVKNGFLTGHCRTKDEGQVYMSICTVVVHNDSSLAKEGRYMGILTNSIGDLSFVFEVMVNATIPQSSSAGSVGAIIGGIVAAVLIIVIIVVVVVRRRKQGTSKSSSPADGVKYTAVPPQQAAARANGQGDHSTHPVPTRHMNEPQQPLLGKAHTDRRESEDKDVYENLSRVMGNPVPQDGADPSQLYTEVQKKPQEMVSKGRQKETEGLNPPPGSSGNPQEEEENNVYAVVNKKRQPAAAAAAAAPASSSLSTVVPPAIVPRSKDKQRGTGKSNTNDGCVTANAPPPDEASSIYGNINALQPHFDQNAGSSAPAGDRVQNDDGLCYVAIDFSDRAPGTTRPVVAPVDESVTYSAVDFTRTAPVEK